MPNKLSDAKIRVSYAEDVETRQALAQLAKARGLRLTDIVKEATAAYLRKQKTQKR